MTIAFKVRAHRGHKISCQTGATDNLEMAVAGRHLLDWAHPEFYAPSVYTSQVTPGFAAAGGSVNFCIEQGSVRFEINLAATKLQRLTVDAKLLNLARLVVPASVNGEARTESRRTRERLPLLTQTTR